MITENPVQEAAITLWIWIFARAIRVHVLSITKKVSQSHLKNEKPQYFLPSLMLLHCALCVWCHYGISGNFRKNYIEAAGALCSNTAPQNIFYLVNQVSEGCIYFENDQYPLNSTKYRDQNIF